MSYRSKQFKDLQKIWYDKLKSKGFKDIEDSSKEERPLEAWHSLRFQRISTIQFELTDAYFYRAKELLNTYEFKNKTHRRIWELHCEGYSKRQIEKQISHFKKTYKRESIGLILKKISKECK